MAENDVQLVAGRQPAGKRNYDLKKNTKLKGVTIA